MATPTRAINMIDAGSMIFRRVFIAVSSLRLVMRCLPLCFRLRRGAAGFAREVGSSNGILLLRSFMPRQTRFQVVFKVRRCATRSRLVWGVGMWVETEKSAFLSNIRYTVGVSIVVC